VEWVEQIVGGIRVALSERADPAKGPGMQAYMKDVAPFFGVQAPDRRACVRQVLKECGDPEDLGLLADMARALFADPERECAYAAADILGRYAKRLDVAFLDDPVEQLLTTKPWWDTVDLLGSAVISPVCLKHPEAREVVLRWSASADIWLIRAAIQHQRGWRNATDIPFVLSLCSDHADNREFFVQKAIGWALRDLAALDADAVTGFVEGHPMLTRVATREAERGLERHRD
jgi:3-methyladenine DNA glycosylase AlkD